MIMLRCVSNIRDVGLKYMRLCDLNLGRLGSSLGSQSHRCRPDIEIIVSAKHLYSMLTGAEQQITRLPRGAFPACFPAEKSVKPELAVIWQVEAAVLTLAG